MCILSPSPVLWSRCSDCGQVRGTTRRRSWVCVCILSPSPVLWSRCSDCGQVWEDYTEEELGLCMYPLTVPGPVVQVL